MKLKLLMTAILVFALTGCQNEDKNNAPEISGEEDVIVLRYDNSIDWTELVTAWDDTDGDIIITNEMINLSLLDVTKEGFYDIYYTVEDSTELVSTFTVTVEVIAKNTGLYVVYSNNLLGIYFDDTDSLISTILGVRSEVVVSSIIDGKQLAEIILGESFETIKDENNYDQIITKIVTTRSDRIFLFVMHKTDKGYRALNKTELFNSSELAIDDYLGLNAPQSSITFIGFEGPLTEEEVLNNPYMQTKYDYTSLQEISTEFGIPIDYIELYSVDWEIYDNDVSDIVILLHYGDYYLTKIWL